MPRCPSARDAISITLKNDEGHRVAAESNREPPSNFAISSATMDLFSNRSEAMNQPHSGVLNYGGSPSNNPAELADANFPGSAFQPLSFCCTPIEMLSNDGKDSVLFRGTGFFYLHQGRPFLVTNWHIVSGRNVFTRVALNAGYVPSRVRYHGISVHQTGEQIIFRRTAWTLTIPEFTQSLLENPPLIDGSSVDIWAAPVPTESVILKNPARQGFSQASAFSSIVNDHVSTNIACRAGDDCLILGYPLSNYEGLKPPVWKRASLASEPGIPLDGKPMFLIDGYTTASMSGSPVFRRITLGVVQDPRTGMLAEQSMFSFIGVYAGRLQSSESERTGLGYGWYGSLIGKIADYYGYDANSLSPGSLEESGFNSDGSLAQ